MTISLNAQQLEAVNHLNGPALVIAVPGSGKTRVLTERVAKLLESGISPKNLVCMTFTNKAAEEMKTRVVKRLGKDRIGCFVGTFHSLCSLIIRTFGANIGYGKFTICDSDEQFDLVKQIARQRGYKIERGEIFDVIKSVNNWRENLWDRERFEKSVGNDSVKIEIADCYLEKIKSNNILDFSGLLSETVRLLESDENVRGKLQEQMKYVMVDECQDTNYVQFRIIDIITEKYKNIFVVGDPEQSIFKFRGARHQNIQDFISKHKGCKIIPLPVNYRSTPQIVEVSNALIRHNKTHMGAVITTDNPDGEKVRCLSFRNDLAEADFVSEKIGELLAGGYSNHDIAVLYRMNNMSEAIERAMRTRGIKCKIIGGRSFYDRKEIKDCVSMLRVKVNPHDSLAFHRVASTIEGMGDTTIANIENMATQEGIPVLDACAKYGTTAKIQKIKQGCHKISVAFGSSPSGTSECLKHLIKELDYEDSLRKHYGDVDAMDRIRNIQQMSISADRFAEDGGSDSIDKYLQMTALMTSADSKDDKDSVYLMSMHASKGLEFPVVFVIGVEEGILPHKLSVTEDPDNGLEEERRLAFVALTRAKHSLYVSYCNNRRVFVSGGNSFDKKSGPSQFLFDCGLLDKKSFYHKDISVRS